LIGIISIVLSLLFRQDEQFKDWINIIFQFFSNLIFLWIIVKTIYNIIDYEMDFNIFSPKQFTLYRQHGIFTAGSTSVATSTIKIVKAVNTNFIQSLFGF
jgi:vacuolar-type H+-ATPase subunit I/STV1